MKKALAILIINFIPLASYAAGISIPNPLKTTDFVQLIDRVVSLVFTAGLALAPISIIIAGIMFMTAEGQPAKVDRAKDIIKWTFIGIFVLVCSKALVTLLRTTIGG